MSRNLATQDSVLLQDILPRTKSGVRLKGLKGGGQSKYITLDVVKKFVQKSRMPEARALADILGFPLIQNTCARNKKLSSIFVITYMN